MKKKSFNRKLDLRKETVSNLNENDMTRVKGGWFVTTYTETPNCHLPEPSQYCEWEETNSLCYV